jgi:hypothetical protein
MVFTILQLSGSLEMSSNVPKEDDLGAIKDALINASDAIKFWRMSDALRASAEVVETIAQEGITSRTPAIIDELFRALGPISLALESLSRANDAMQRLKLLRNPDQES